MLSVSGPHGTDVPKWAADINATIDTILAKLNPDPKQLILQAVVGGPDDNICPCTSLACPYEEGKIRASRQRKYIEQAIVQVIGAQHWPDLTVVMGYQPQVRSCSDYADDLGHLTPGGAFAAGEVIGNYYLLNNY